MHDLIHIMKKSFGLVIDSIHKIDRIGCSVSTVQVKVGVKMFNKFGKMYFQALQVKIIFGSLIVIYCFSCHCLNVLDKLQYY